MLLTYLKSPIGNSWRQILLLSLSTLVGTILRLTDLTRKTIWSDEFSTIVFSLGNSFKTVPLNRVITSDILLQPFTSNRDATVGNSIYNLFTESTHPPMYFILSHWWIKLFPTEAGLASLWGFRSLSALFGIVAIPAIFYLSWLTFHSLLAAQFSAALMAVSPFAIYLSQEARHYTLATLWIIGSLCCFVGAIQAYLVDRKIPLPLAFLWILFNTLGIATHYFVAISIAAEALAIAWLKWEIKTQLTQCKLLNWQRIYLVGFGTLAGCCVWIPVWQLHDRELTEWIYSQSDGISRLLTPIGQLLIAGISMLMSLPVESTNPVVTAVSLAVMIVVFVSTIYLAKVGFDLYESKLSRPTPTKFLGTFIICAIFIFLVLTYAKFSDLLSGIRYNFVYFPAFIVIVSGCLSAYWYFPNFQPRVRILSPKKFVYLLLVLSIISSLTVVSGLSFQKPYRPDLMLDKITEASELPLLVSTVYRQHSDIAKMMGLAWEMRRQKVGRDARFLLSDDKCDRAAEPHSNKLADCLGAERVLANNIKLLKQPLDVWVVNYPSLDLNLQNNCQVISPDRVKVQGFRAKLYRCLP